MNEPTRHENSLAAPLRMQLALPRFGIAPPLDERFLTWMAARVELEPRPLLGVSFDAAHERIAWFSESGPPVVGPAGATGRGAWIGADGTAEDEGSFATGAIDVVAAFEAAPVDLHGPSQDAVERWGRDTGASVARLEYCTSGRPHVSLSLEPPSDDTVDQAMAGLDLFRALGVEGPPPTVLAPLLNANGALRAVVALVANGVRAAGFSAALDQERVVQLLVATDGTTVTPCAETLGVLGVDTPAEMSALNTSAGTRVLLHAPVG